MAVIQWDQPGARQYETGLDRGVLYLPDGSAVPWNGLLSVDEAFDIESSPVYYDGRKISVLATLGSFSASMRALTYPDEFQDFEGIASFRSGVFLKDQRVKTFNLSYRTIVGNDIDADAGHKIHVLYNVVAIPSSKGYATINDSLSPTEFEWDISAIPEETEEFAPTAHIILDTSDFDQWFLTLLEEKLYGDSDTDASLPSIGDLLEFIAYWTTAIIVDNGDLTFTVISDNAALVTMIEEETIDVTKLNIVYIDESDVTVSEGFKHQYTLIDVTDNEDGTWTAETEVDSLIDVDAITGEFSIDHATSEAIDADTYNLSNTVVAQGD